MPSTRALRAESHADAVVMPFTPFIRANGRNGLRMGVFDAQGRVVPGSLLSRSYGKVGFAAEFTAVTRAAAFRDRRSVVYGGRLARHFGHFTLESLANLWYAKAHPELPIAWAWPSGKPEPRYMPWQQGLLEVLGITNESVFVDRPTRFDAVVVPDAGYRIKDFFAPEHAAFLAAYPSRPRDGARRLWLSRSRVDEGIIHAPRLEAELEAAGWTVVHPQTLTISAQLELLASAGHVAGDEGSAFHLLALLADVRGLRVDIFCRHPDRSVEEQNANYQTIAEARGLDQHMHVMQEELLIESHSAHVTKLAATLAGHLEVLGVPVRRPSPEGPGPAAALAGELASVAGARACLEVTTSAPVTLDLAIPRRHVVSEAFDFDPRGRGGQGLVLLEMPAGEYLDHVADPTVRFDLVVIDVAPAEIAGLVARAGELAHPATTWLIAGEPTEVRPGVGPGAGSGADARRLVLGDRAWTVIPGSQAVAATLG